MGAGCFVITRTWSQQLLLPRYRISRRTCSTVRGSTAARAKERRAEDDRPRLPDKRRSPYTIVSFLRSHYVAHMNELAMRGASSVEKDPLSELDKALMETGIHHEAKVLEQLRGLGLDVVSIRDRGERGREQTEKYLRENRQVIHQAVFRDDLFQGIADFLLLSPEGVDWKRILAGDKDALKQLHSAKCSAETNYSVMEVKTSASAKAEYLLQTLCYADMLEKRTGRCADSIFFWLGSRGTPLTAQRSKYTHFFRSLRDEFIKFIVTFDVNDSFPQPDRPVEKLVPWTKAAQKVLVDTDSLEQVAGIKQSQIGALRTLNVTTMQQLAESSDKSLRGDQMKRLREQALLQTQTNHLRKQDPLATPAYKVLPHSRESCLGLASLPPQSPEDLFFDIEGFPLYALEHGRGLEYLYGYVDTNGVFTAMWAHDHREEATMTEEFVVEVRRRWMKDPEMHVYHYGAYEVSALKRVASQLGGDTDVYLAELIENDVFVDILTVVKQGLMIGEESYSLKKVEKLYGVSRHSDELTDAASSVGMYFRLLSSHDKSERLGLMTTIADYNRQDCVSLADLTTWLRQLQTREGIYYVKEPEVKVDEEGLNEGEIEMMRVSGACGRGASARIEDARVVVEGEAVARELLRTPSEEVLGHLVSFHLREGRPARRRFRERLVKSDMNDLYSDAECISLVRVKKQGEIEKARGTAWAVDAFYDALEPIRIAAGARVAAVRPGVPANGPIYGTVKRLGAGLISLEFSKREEDLPARFSVIGLGDLGFCPAVMRQSILQTAKSTLALDGEAGSSGLVQRFLQRQAPQVWTEDGRVIGIEEDVDTVKSNPLRLAEMIDHLKESVLIIQGPPGSGKTRLCAEVIAELARRGRRVAVASNSHPSIDNVLLKIAASGVDNVVKVPTLESNGSGNVGKATSVAAAVNKKQAKVVGATVYQLSRPEVAGLFDVLFIDEAGQVPLANFVAMAPAAKNSVLVCKQTRQESPPFVGDQRQLEMPLQSVHDESSGKSCLQFALGEDCVTVPKNLGIFLDVSFRMAPSLCSLVSEGIYDGQLHAHSSTANNGIELVEHDRDSIVHRSSGLQFVGHVSDPSKAGVSPVEVALTKRIVNDLLGSPFRTARRSGTLTEEDILVVAPFNLQVSALASSLGRAFKVGTVDKFQGQEAPVVVVSMCGFDADADANSRRNAGFVLRKNRLNVAISRAQCLAIVIGSVELTRSPIENMEDMELVSLFCRIVEKGSDAHGTFLCVDASAANTNFTLNTIPGHLQSLSTAHESPDG